QHRPDHPEEGWRDGEDDVFRGRTDRPTPLAVPSLSRANRRESRSAGQRVRTPCRGSTPRRGPPSNATPRGSSAPPPPSASRLARSSWWQRPLRRALLQANPGGKAWVRVPSLPLSLSSWERSVDVSEEAVLGLVRTLETEVGGPA